jgi:hypothetical protein
MALPWGRGVGKSWFIRQVPWISFAKAKQTGKPVRWIALAPTLKQWRDIHEEHLRDEVNNDWAWLKPKLDGTTLKITFPDGSWWKPFPAELHSSKSARGQRCDGLVIDEADDVPISVFHSVVKPWFSEPWSQRVVLAGGTPRLGRKGLLYHLHSLGLNAQEDSYHSVFATWRDAPDQVDPAVVEDARRTTPPAIFQREWECNFDAAEGLVYGDVFDERFHVREPPPGQQWSEILIGGDFGYEDPGVLLLIGVVGSGRDAVCYVLEEIYEQHQTEDWWIDRLRVWLGWYPNARLYHDPSAKSRVEAYRKQAKTRIVSPVNNAIEEGVAAVAGMLKTSIVGEGAKAERVAHLYVSPRCRNTIWEFGAYKRKQDAHDPDRYLEDVVDKDNHSQDSLRYVCATRFGSLYKSGAVRTSPSFDSRV